MFGMGRTRAWQIALAIAITAIFVACSNGVSPDFKTVKNLESKTNKLSIWWEQGYNHAEDEAIRQVVGDWQNKTGNQVELSFFSTDELSAKAKRAVAAGNAPDIMMDTKADRILYPQLAWTNKLEDVADIIKPIKDDYRDNILQAVSYRNFEQKKRSYYAVPIDQIAIFIFYWQNMLSSLGLNSNDIPQDWNGFWQFWQQAQNKLKTEQNLDLYALGFTLGESNGTSDTYYLFEQILAAHDVNLFDRQGKLAIDRPEVRQGIIECLDWYAQLYRQGYIPPDAVEWTNPSNNRSFLNRVVLMTPNSTFSIPATVRQDKNTYLDRLGVVEFPNKPSGRAIRPLVAVRQAVIFHDSQHKALAKDFLSYIIQPQVAIDYLKASGNRTQPVRTSVWSDPFWQNTPDPYLAIATKVLTSKPTQLFQTVAHPAYSEVLANNVWGKTLIKVTAKKVNPQQAADEAIAEIEKIFARWGTHNY